MLAGNLLIFEKFYLEYLIDRIYQIYDVGDFAMLCMAESNRNERWTGGEFLSIDQVIIWNNLGKAYLYKLPVK